MEESQNILLAIFWYQNLSASGWYYFYLDDLWRSYAFTRRNYWLPYSKYIQNNVLCWILYEFFETSSNPWSTCQIQHQVGFKKKKRLYVGYF